jgi:hypothetical protein
MHQNILHDRQISPDAKIDVQCNVSKRAFMESVPDPPEHEKIVHRCFVAQKHGNALRDPQISQDAKIHVQHNVSYRTFYQICISPT